MSVRALLVALPLLLVSLASTAIVGATGAHQAAATPIGEGTFTGAVPDGAGHWYRVSVPAGKAVHVAYTIVSGDDWNDLYLVDSAGSIVAWVSDGWTGTYDPEEADAWIFVEAYWGPVAYSFTVSLLEAPPQDDAGSGQDAGQQQATALPVQPGRIAGRVRATAGDVADWYRIDVPAGTILDVHSASNAYVELYSAEGRRIAAVVEYDSPYNPRTYSLVAGADPLFIRIDYGDPYSFVVDASRPADLRVDAVEVRDVEIATQAGPTGASYAREVLVTVSNVGEGASRKASLRVVSTHEGAATTSRLVGERALDLDAGAQVTVAIPWDGTGQAGDVTLVASVSNEHEVQLDNNEGRADAFVLASGLPTGLDLLNHEARAGSATVRVEYGGDRIGVGTSAGFVGFDRGALTLP